MKVAVLLVLLRETVPATEPPEPLVSVKVQACTASLNVAVGAIDTATLVAPEAGLSLVTVGATT